MCASRRLSRVRLLAPGLVMALMGLVLGASIPLPCATMLGVAVPCHCCPGAARPDTAPARCDGEAPHGRPHETDLAHTAAVLCLPPAAEAPAEVVPAPSMPVAVLIPRLIAYRVSVSTAAPPALPDVFASPPLPSERCAWLAVFRI